MSFFLFFLTSIIPSIILFTHLNNKNGSNCYHSKTFLPFCCQKNPDHSVHLVACPLRLCPSRHALEILFFALCQSLEVDGRGAGEGGEALRPVLLVGVAHLAEVVVAGNGGAVVGLRIRDFFSSLFEKCNAIQFRQKWTKQFRIDFSNGFPPIAWSNLHCHKVLASIVSCIPAVVIVPLPSPSCLLGA